MVVVFWENEPQFAVSIPKVNEGFETHTEGQLVGFIQTVTQALDRLGNDWWDCTMLAKICRDAGLPVTRRIPTHDKFRRVDV